MAQTPQRPAQPQHNFVTLIFLINGNEYPIDKINVNQPLKVGVERALADSGNASRPLADWVVRYNDRDLDVNGKVEDFHFPAGAQIYLTLRTGQGGNR